jgi:hypothetical protein
LLDSVARAGLRDRTTIIVTTDHGFKKVKNVIHMNVALRDAGLIRVKGAKAESCDAYVMPQGGLAFVYVTDPAKRAELLPKLKTLCAGIEGVKEVVDGNDGPRLGMPTPAENQGMGDLVLYAKDGYAFFQGLDGAEVIRESKTYLGTHGYPLRPRTGRRLFRQRLRHQARREAGSRPQSRRGPNDCGTAKRALAQCGRLRALRDSCTVTSEAGCD